jgi:hypothetical protein
MKKFNTVLMILCSLVLIGCASPIKAPTEKDTSAKIFTPIADKASLFIYRNENYGMALGMPVMVNGHAIGETGAKTFFRLNLSAGTYVISSKSETISEIPLTLTEGKNYFVWQEIRMGLLTARTALRLVDENQGKNGVMESALLSPKTGEDVLSKSAIRIK